MKRERQLFNRKIIKIFKRDFNIWEARSKKYLQDKDSTRKLLINARKKADLKSSRLNEMWDNIQLLFSFVKDWNDGAYRKVSNKTIVIIITGILYFVVPTDIIPDFIIALGLADDAVVLGFIIKQIEDELKKYNEWKSNYKHEIDKSK